jgi:hypothetical protein
LWKAQAVSQAGKVGTACGHWKRRVTTCCSSTKPVWLRVHVTSGVCFW